MSHVGSSPRGGGCLAVTTGGIGVLWCVTKMGITTVLLVARHSAASYNAKIQSLAQQMTIVAKFYCIYYLIYCLKVCMELINACAAVLFIKVNDFLLQVNS